MQEQYRQKEVPAMIHSNDYVIIRSEPPSEESVTLRELFRTGRDLPLAVWQKKMRNPLFGWQALCLVWQSDGQRFSVSRGGICRDADGCETEPCGPVSLAHPVEMDAPEILKWRRWLKAERLQQPFRQMTEPVVLRDGFLPGEYRPVESAGLAYEMCARYEEYKLPLRCMPALEEIGCRFTVRRRWDAQEHAWAEIEVVNIVTPAGILYDCKPNQMMERLGASKNRGLHLKYFYPFQGVRLRLVNHTAAVLETYLLAEALRRDDLELLLPHLACMEAEELRAFHGKSKAGSRCREMLERILAREEVPQC